MNRILSYVYRISRNRVIRYKPLYVLALSTRQIVAWALMPLSFTLRGRDLYIYLTRRAGCDVVIKRSRNPILRNIFHAHYAAYRMSRASYTRVIELLLPLSKMDNLAQCDYTILTSSLIEAGRAEEARSVLERLISLSRRHKWRTFYTEIAMLSISLNDMDTAVEFSDRADSTWLSSYVASLYGSDRGINHDSLSDRQIDPSTPDNAINVALLGYKSPLEYQNGNIGDYIQTLAVMRHIARFYDGGNFSCNNSLKDVFLFLTKSWQPEDRSVASAPINIVIIDRDCARIRQTAWLPFFGWFGKYPLEFPMTFPLPTNVRPVFFSFHLNDIRMLTPAMRDYLRRYEPIGCRDENTRAWLASAGVEAFFSGCVTTTLNLPGGQSMTPLNGDTVHQGEHYQVDDIGEDIPGTVKLTHSINSVTDKSFTHYIKRSLDILLTYKQARSVSTSRLHCYLPCRALGTSVTFNTENPDDIRFDGLVGIGADEFDLMSTELTELLNTIFSLIISDAGEAAVYRAWRDMTLPLVKRDSI